MAIQSDTTEAPGYPKKQALLSGNWPEEMRLLATRKWQHLDINNDLYEVTTSFMNNLAIPVERDIVTTFLALYDESRFVDWLQAVCTRLLNDTLTKDWFDDLDLTKKLRERFDSRIQVVMTFPPDGLGFITTGTPSVGESLHVVFILCQT